MRHALLAGLLLLLPAAKGIACSARQWDPEEFVANEPVYSANGRYCAILRWHDVPDFSSERAGKVFRLDSRNDNEDYIPPPYPEERTVAWYEVTPAGHRRIAELHVSSSLTEMLVADSGRYLVMGRTIHPGMCTASPEAKDTVVAVYRADGSTVGSLTAGDILAESDLHPLQTATDDAAIRTESQDTERLILSFDIRTDWQGPPVWRERRIDLETARLLDDKRPLFPLPRIYAEPARGLASSPSRDRVAIEPDAFFAALLDAPLPEMPRVAILARIRGTVIVEADVDERGRVESLRVVKPLPFGLDVAAAGAVRQWRFRPFRVDGRLVKATGRIVLHASDLDEATWNEKHVTPFR